MKRALTITVAMAIAAGCGVAPEQATRTQSMDPGTFDAPEVGSPAGTDSPSPNSEVPNQTGSDFSVHYFGVASGDELVLADTRQVKIYGAELQPEILWADFEIGGMTVEDDQIFVIDATNGLVQELVAGTTHGRDLVNPTSIATDGTAIYVLHDGGTRVARIEDDETDPNWGGSSDPANEIALSGDEDFLYMMIPSQACVSQIDMQTGGAASPRAQFNGGAAYAGRSPDGSMLTIVKDGNDTVLFDLDNDYTYAVVAENSFTSAPAADVEGWSALDEDLVWHDAQSRTVQGYSERDGFYPLPLN